MEKEIAEIKERLTKLEKAVFEATSTAPAANDSSSDLDFSLNERAFIKKYSSGFNGQEFFVLISAYLAEGKIGATIDLLEIKSIWKSCAGMIKVPYASIFSTRAKENGWVDSLKDARGSYVLGKNWQEIFKKHDQNS